MNSLKMMQARLNQVSDPQKALHSGRFFKSGPGQYGEGDQFRGITVPQLRIIAKEFKAISLNEITEILKSKWHEDRLMALLIMVGQYKKADLGQRNKLHELYLQAIEKKQVNNWDLVDSSAEVLMGSHYEVEEGHASSTGLKLLKEWAKSELLWKRRVAVVACIRYIRNNQFREIETLSLMLIKDKEDLMHKAVGWMLREAGKRDLGFLKAFLRQNATTMPRTALRYAIEKFSENERKAYLAMRSSN
jgi:3-methyladenine DNA glycosylase AlkD